MMPTTNPVTRSLLLGLAGLLGLASLTGCGPAPGSNDPTSSKSETGLVLADWPLSSAAVRGKAVYDRWCAGCHGPEGNGRGAAAAHLDPRPRNFQKGHFKFRTTPSGRLPTIEDILRTVTCGLPGSSMPSFALVSEPERRDVSQFVLEVSLMGKAADEVSYVVQSEELPLAEVKKTRLTAIAEQVRSECAKTARAFPVPEFIESTPESVERGRTRYMKECANCHGASGRGDGGSAYTLRDWENAPIVPRDFTTGVFRAGSSPRDLYIRMKSGLNGTPMPSISGADDDLWSLVHFMMSLKDPAARPGKSGCATAEDHR